MINLRIGTRLIGGFLALTGLIRVIGLIALGGLRDVSAHYQEALQAYCGRARCGPMWWSWTSRCRSSTGSRRPAR